MSIIFDALKRAEAQRKKGQAPTLASVRAASGARSKIRLWALASLFATLGLCAWWFWSNSTKPNATIAAVPSAKLPISNLSGSEPAKPDLAKPDLVKPDLSQTELSASVPDPVVATVLSSGEHKESSVARLSVPSLDAPLTGAAQFNKGSEPEVVAVAPISNSGKEVAPIPSNPVTAIEPSMPKPADVIQPQTTVIAATEQKPEPTLPSIFELDYKLRHELPKMAVSMYVYNAQQQFRFVIIAGKRYAEGEQIESKVSITKIRADGLECEFQGTRFFYPRQSL